VSALQPGPRNGLTDVAGVHVGHASRTGEGWLSGTTVVTTGPAGAVAGVDVRGGGPGTRETDLLDPRNAVEAVHALVLTGGSAYGLATADGVVQRLAAAGTGLVVDPERGVLVPIVPGAVVYDLGRGGDWTCRPGPELGAAAFDDATDPTADSRPEAQGVVGAGTGAVAGGLKGGIGSASVVLPGGEVVAALAVVNSLGSTVDPATGELYGLRSGLAGEFAGVVRPSRDDVERHRARLAAAPGPITLNTTLGVVATDVGLSKAQCAKVAGTAHDGLARAIRPAHTMFDGDTVFALSTRHRPAPAPLLLHAVLTAAADCFARAVVHALLAADSVQTPAGTWPSYRDAFPSASSPDAAGAS
jgi:L-aminopeptidase/D-esterase-like protein